MKTLGGDWEIRSLYSPAVRIEKKERKKGKKTLGSLRVPRAGGSKENSAEFPAGAAREKFKGARLLLVCILMVGWGARDYVIEKEADEIH